MSRFGGLGSFGLGGLADLGGKLAEQSSKLQTGLKDTVSNVTTASTSEKHILMPTESAAKLKFYENNDLDALMKRHEEEKQIIYSENQHLRRQLLKSISENELDKILSEQAEESVKSIKEQDLGVDKMLALSARAEIDRLKLDLENSAQASADKDAHMEKLDNCVTMLQEQLELSIREFEGKEIELNKVLADAAKMEEALQQARSATEMWRGALEDKESKLHSAQENLQALQRQHDVQTNSLEEKDGKLEALQAVIMDLQQQIEAPERVKGPEPDIPISLHAEAADGSNSGEVAALQEEVQALQEELNTLSSAKEDEASTLQEEVQALQAELEAVSKSKSVEASELHDQIQVMEADLQAMASSKTAHVLALQEQVEALQADLECARSTAGGGVSALQALQEQLDAAERLKSDTAVAVQKDMQVLEDQLREAATCKETEVTALKEAEQAATAELEAVRNSASDECAAFQEQMQALRAELEASAV
eukprot:gene4194-5170_t